MKASLQLPDVLGRLIAEGLWPERESAQLQNLTPLIPNESVRKFAPDEERIFLYPPPFATVAEAAKHNKYWEDERSAPGEIDPERALLIGDFGLGSDTAIILDYRTGTPRLLRLQWGDKENHWIEFGIEISELASLIRKHKAEPAGCTERRDRVSVDNRASSTRRR